MKKWMSALFLTLVLAAGVNARTTTCVMPTCPLCGTKFSAEMDMSGTTFDMRLDLKPLGAISAPMLIPVCPKCDFVLFQDELTPEETKACWEIVRSPGYAAAKGRAPYYKLGLLFEGLKKPEEVIADTFLQASWQEEGDEELYRECAERTLAHLDTYFSSQGEGGEGWGTMQLLKGEPQGEEDEPSRRDLWETKQLLKGELLRRLGLFDKAVAHVDGLLASNAFQSGFSRSILEFEKELILSKDCRPHAISEAEKKSPQK